MNGIDDAVIKQGAELIKKGSLVAFPTETVYGLGANALSAEAVAGIFEAKKRPFFDPLICHVSDMEMLASIVKEMPKSIIPLIEKFWPGPLTVVLPKADIIPDIVTAGLDTVAVRMPSHPIALSLIKQSGVPIAAPSANPFGYLSPTTAEHVKDGLKNNVDLIIDGGKCSVGVESTIIRIGNDGNYLLRPGGIPLEEIESLTGPLLRPEKVDIPDAPGLLPSHYSPHSKVIIVEEGEQIPDEANICLLSFQKKRTLQNVLNQLVLSEKGSEREAAANLFTYLHMLDDCKPDIIYAERVPEIGLGLAVMNRLRKAAAEK